MKHIKCYLTLFLVLNFVFSFAQNESLELKLQAVNSPQEKIPILGQLIDYYQKRDVKKAIPYAQKALVLAKQINKNIVLAESQFWLGKTYSLASQLDSASIYLNEAQTIYSGLNQKVKQADVLLEIAKIKSNQSQLNEAMGHYTTAEKLYQAANDLSGVARVNIGVGDVFYLKNDWNKSIEYCEKAIAIQKKLDVPAEMAKSYINLAYPLMIQEQLDLALEAASTAINLHQQAGSLPIDMASAYNARGNVYKFMERYDDAIADYQENLRIGEETGMERAVMVSHANLGHVYKMKEAYQEAVPHLMKAQKMMFNRKETRNLWENYMHLSDVHAGLGDYKEANEWVWKYADEREDIYEDRITLLESEQTAKFESGQRAATIKLQEDKIDQQRNIQWLTYGILALLGGILFLLWRNYRTKQKSNKILNQTNDKLNATNDALAKKNEENELLLKEIHHRVKNNLQVISSLLSLQSANIEDPSALDAVKESQNRVRSMALIHQKLYQGERLAAVEMKNYFADLGETILDSFGEYDDRVEIDYPMNNLELDVDTAIPIGLIVNELVTNSIKYGFPDQSKGKIQISLTKNESADQLYLVVADDGIGMKSQEKDFMESVSGFGMRLVHLLTKQLEGTLVTRQEKGTIIEMGFPLKYS